MTHTARRREARSLAGRLAATTRAVRRRIDSIASSAQLGPSRHDELRDFWPGRPR